MKDINQRIANLSPDQRALLELKIREKKLDIRVAQTIPRRKDVDPLPLSFAQQRLWFLDQLEPDISVYNMSFIRSLNGLLNIPVLEKCLNEIIRRHEVLRTHFITIDGQPTQKIFQAETFFLPIVDLKTWPRSEREEQVRRLMKEETGRTFDLSSDLLIRAKLFIMEEQKFNFVLTMHHIVSDGWSISIFEKELAALYMAFLNEEPSPLPKLPIQYADFAVWQRQWMQGEVLEKQLSFWKKQLDKAPSLLDLPTDWPRPADQSFRGESCSLTISKQLSKALNDLSMREGCTLFMTMLSAFKILLYRLSGQDDILVGTPMASRNRVEMESLIGFFINTLTLRSDLSGDPGFRKLLTQVREVTLDAYAHQDIPFEKLVEELHPQRDLTRTPFFQVFINMFNIEAEQLNLPGLTVETLLTDREESKFDLTLYIREHSEKIHLKLVYKADLFHKDRMFELLLQFSELLSQIVETPDLGINQFSLTTPSSRELLPNPVEALLKNWEGSIPDRISVHSSRVPEKIAAIDENVGWTYSELDSRSNQLANFLLDKGIRSEEIVAVYSDRSASLVWALLGILKAGASFVILDSAYPSSRLIEYLNMVKPIGWIMIGSTGTIPEDLSEYISNFLFRFRLVLPDGQVSDENDLLENYTLTNPEVKIEPDNRAYVMFTSGTTGGPKAIEGTHRPLSHFLQWHCQTFELNENDRFSMLSGLSHDILLRDIFTPLWLGATLFIPSHDDILGGKLNEWLKMNKISISHLTPAMVQILASNSISGNDNITSLRYAFFGGDRLKKSHIDEVVKIAPFVTCVNFYGATETPQAMSYFVIPDQNDKRNEGLAEKPKEFPLGKGIKDVQLLILNASGKLAGIGEVGEIHIRTPYLAKGYMGDNKSTHLRFIINPFTREPGDRVFKTGDFGRYLNDGTIEFIGRMDDQVKVRGFRVELGEIEAVLDRSPSVKQVVVLAKEDESGDKQLVAYIVAEKVPGLSISGLRNFLRQKLPNYMVPATFVFLDTFPLTPNGKVDRKSLPAPDKTRPESEEKFIGPRDELERQLVNAWEMVLEIRPISIRDNFFELGGHSLLGVRLVSEIEKSIGKSIPLKAIFRFSTVEQMADAIKVKKISFPRHEVVLEEHQTPMLSPEQYKLMLSVIAGCKHQPVKPGSLMIQINTNGFKRPLFWCFNSPETEMQNLAKYLGNSQPVYGLFSGSGVLKERGTNDFKAIADHYINEIVALQPEGPYLIGGNCGGANVATEIAIGLWAQGKEVGRLCLLEYFDPQLYEYLGKMLLLYGKESHLRAYGPFRWPDPGWSNAFMAVPEVDWVPGAHGEFFDEPNNIIALARKVSSFLENEDYLFSTED